MLSASVWTKALIAAVKEELNKNNKFSLALADNNKGCTGTMSKMSLHVWLY